MRITKACLVAGATLLVAVAGSAGAGEDEANEKTKRTESVNVAAAPPSFELPQYVPAQRGRPARTVGGATRSVGDRTPGLYALVPDHVGQTVSSQPSLFWYIDGTPSAATRMQFTLIDEESIEPRVQTTLSRPSQAGIYRIRLADYGVKLDPNVEYEWSVAILVDPKEPARDIVATGWIDRVSRSSALEDELASQDKSRAAHVYASQGLWYDALEVASDQIERNPADARARANRSALLQQVGLDAAAN